MSAIKKLSAWVDQRNSIPLMLFLFVVIGGFFWLYSASPISQSAFIKLSGKEGLLDARLYYSAQLAHTTLSHYGTAGRQLSLIYYATDFVYIVIYGLGFAFLMTRALRAASAGGTAWLRLNVLPFGVGLFDSAENIFILGMLGIYPADSTALGTAAGIATMCKWLVALSGAVCFMASLVMMGVRRLGFRTRAERRR